MWRTCLILTAIVLAVGMIGCGGSDNGDPINGEPIDDPIDEALVGTWQPYEAAILGDAIGPREAFDWDEDIISMTVQFIGDGNVTLRYYGHGGLVRTETGTWTAEAGNATLNIDGEETNIEYSPDGRVMIIAFTENTAQFRTRWVPVIDASGQAAELARTWQVALVEVNAATVPMADFFGVPEEASVALGMTPDGTLHVFMLDEESRIVEYMQGAWATEDELIVLDPPGTRTLRGVWDAGNTSITFLNDDGNTAKFHLTPWAPAGERDEQLLGEWTPQSVTINNQQADMAQFFEWQPGTEEMFLDLWADGTAILRETAGDDVLWAALTWWATNGGQFTLALEEALEMDYVIAGDVLTVAFIQNGDSITITWLRS